jgi:cystathionine gamma-synthase
MSTPVPNGSYTEECHGHPGWHPLHAAPAWQPNALGQPLPDDPHAVSVALPTWADIVGYEENDPRVHQALLSGYPRFVLPPLLVQLGAWLSERYELAPDSVVYPYRHVRQAEAAMRWIQHEVRVQEGDGVARISDSLQLIDHSGMFAALAVTGDYAPLAKAYWQHSGQGLSTRAAEMILREGCIHDDDQARDDLRQRMHDLTGVAPKRIFLYPSGMAAYFAAVAAVEAVQHAQRDSSNQIKAPWAQIGFPYVDILKVQQRFTAGGGNLYADLSAAAEAPSGPWTGVTIEVPGNPLLTCPDLRQARQLADSRGALLIIDDTIATPAAVNVLPYADLVMTSLTKAVAGSGNVLAGSIIVPDGPQAEALEQALQVHDPGNVSLLGADAAVAAAGMGSLTDRLARMSAGARAVANWLRQRPEVASVFYPDEHDSYLELARDAELTGPLLSFVLQDAEHFAPQLYDAMRLSKGPSLGCDFTLVCPFTQLAHYHELDWAEGRGVSPWLLRVSVGCESVDELLDRFSAAFDQVFGSGLSVATGFAQN